MNFLVEIYSWELPKLFSGSSEIKVGDKVIVATDLGNDIGRVVKIYEKNQEKAPKILRLTTPRDEAVFAKQEKEKKEFLNICREQAKKLDLNIKLVDAKISLDSKQVIFAFTADGRVDFRELVKSVSVKIKKSIRMQQIGSRDEARNFGGYGICGRQICCAKFSGSIKSITTEMARQQQLSHRGSERISGVCGRLMCCLSYEWEQYKELMAGMPENYSVVKTKEGKGTVIEINAVNQEIKVKLENGEYVTIKKEDLK